MKKIIVDTDPGIDDALAIILLLKSGKLAIKAVTTVAGNATIENVTRNAAYILTLLDREDIPLYSGSGSPLKKDLTLSVVHGKTGRGSPLKKDLTLSVVHGKTGLGTLDISNTPYALTGNDAVEQIIKLVRQSPGELSILALGPLTNIAKAFLKDPDLSFLVKEVIIMGGAINVPGNMSRVAEFNMYVDPEAAEIVFKAHVKKILIPLDVCNQVIMSLTEFERLKESPLYAVIGQLIEQYIIGIKNDPKTEVKGGIVYDAVAAYYLLNPNAFLTDSMNVVIDVEGMHTAGMTVAKKPIGKVRPNVQIALEVQKDRLINEVIRILKN